MKSRYVHLSCILVVLAASALETSFSTPGQNVPTPGYASSSRNIYAVNQSSKNRGSISVYDIGAGHRLIKTIRTVSDVGDVRGVAASAVTGKLYVAYRDNAGVGMIYCGNVKNAAGLWNRAVNP